MIYIASIFPHASSPHRNYTPPGISLPSEMEADMLDAILLDAVFLAAGLAFFAVAIGYTLLCERL